MLARVFVVLAVLGFGVLLVANLGEDPSHVTFSMIAFLISVAALLMTTLQSISIIRQEQLTERAVREVRETGEQMKTLINSDHRLAHDVREDIELDHKIISILEEHGVGDSDEARHKVAKCISQQLRKHTKSKH